MQTESKNEAKSEIVHLKDELVKISSELDDKNKLAEESATKYDELLAFSKML